MICKKCNRNLTEYHFFRPQNTYNKAFFVNPPVNGYCFDCNAPYRCIKCGVEQSADNFRLQGRICKACKTDGDPLSLGIKTRES